MKKGYIPPNQRKTILLLGDDIRTHSGIGTMSKEVVLNTAHHFNWVTIGGAIKHPEAGKAFDLSAQVNKEIGISDSSVKVIATNNYGDANLLRNVVAQENPDALVHFTDPRYWIWLYHMENEIRQKMPMIFYTIWDDLPYPMYNKNFYRSDDMLLCISKQTKNIVKNVLKDYPKPDWAIKYVPHGINDKLYYPIVDDLKFETWKEKFLEEKEYDFVLFWNSRNIRRKNAPDIILAWKLFLDQLPKEKAKKCLLVMHTDPVDNNGTDLPAVVENFCNPEIHKVKFSTKKYPPQELNYLYNISDCHIFMTDNEGWGLGLTESLMAGRMIIAPVQGGMQDQMRFEDENGKWINFTKDHPSNADGRYKKHGEWALPIFPKTRSVKGSPLTPYIFSTQCTIEDAAISMMKVYKMGKEERKRRGLKGREWVTSEESKMTAANMGQGFIDNINTLFEKWEPKHPHSLVKVDDSTFPNNYNESPISLTPEFIKEIQSI
jgi:glycosyltransferase involved in cell wall biosynthesis